MTGVREDSATRTVTADRSSLSNDGSQSKGAARLFFTVYDPRNEITASHQTEVDKDQSVWYDLPAYKECARDKLVDRTATC